MKSWHSQVYFQRADLVLQPKETLSCADLRWPKLFHIIARGQGKNMSDEQVEALSYSDRCSMLNLNPVVVAKHFQ